MKIEYQKVVFSNPFSGSNRRECLALTYHQFKEFLESYTDDIIENVKMHDSNEIKTQLKKTLEELKVSYEKND